MSLNINWNRLDEAVADAVMALLNKKLAAKFHLSNDAPTSQSAAGSAPAGDVPAEYHTPRSPVESDGDENPGEFRSPNAKALNGTSATRSNRASTGSAVSQRASSTFLVSSFSSPQSSAPPPTPNNRAAPTTGAGGQSQSAAKKKSNSSLQISECEVTSLSWGDAPPFIELLSVDDAVDFGLPGTAAASTPVSSQPVQQKKGRQHQETIPRPSSGSDVPSDGSHSSIPGVALSPPSGAASFPFSSSFLREHHPRVPPILIPDEEASAASEAANAKSCLPSGTTGQQLPAVFNSAAIDDSLAKLFGQSGLLIRLHVTYGGQVSLSISCSVRNQINLAENFFLAVSLPMKFVVSQIHLNCYVNINLHRNACRVWLEAPPGCDSPIQKISIRAELGLAQTHPHGDSTGDGGEAGGAVSGAAASDAAGVKGAARRPTSGSSAEPAGATVCVDDRAVAQLVLAELRSVLSRKLVAPHFVEFPMKLPF